ncbi:hypothetical protein CGLO_07024 [Colletotrichum gloeosporioides Cg-14]|uniref:Uncharacterized protein n=1 Tax=Colletotrichum gloeosporioides (strain Cg-14) TaxID=1237896 RepID=T0LXU2_COLGC|nr:hypothetical protein CGLO_07024 [Colletotrichum gloeosporioides Cg-14]
MFPRLLRGPQRAITNGVCVYGKQLPSPLSLCRTSAVAKSSNAFRSFTRHQPFSSGPRNASPSHNPPNTETSTLEITRKAYEKAYAAHRRALLSDKQRLEKEFKQRISKVKAEMAEIERAHRVNMIATKGHNQPEQPRLKIDDDFVRRMPADLVCWLVMIWLVTKPLLGFIVFNVIIWKLTPVPFHRRLKPDDASDTPDEKLDTQR